MGWNDLLKQKLKGRRNQSNLSGGGGFLPDHPPSTLPLDRTGGRIRTSVIGAAGLDLVNETLDGGELLCQVPQPLLEGVELLVEVVQGLGQRLDPAVVWQQSLMVVLQETFHLVQDVKPPVIQNLSQVGYSSHADPLGSIPVVPFIVGPGSRASFLGRHEHRDHSQNQQQHAEFEGHRETSTFCSAAPLL